MKKILLGVLLVLFVVGCAQPMEQTPADETTDQGDTVVVNTGETTDAGTSGSDMVDIAEAFDGTRPFKCTAELEGRDFTFMQKGTKQRSEVHVEELGSTLVSIFDAKIVHTWDPQTKEGMKMDIEKINQMAEEIGKEELPEEPFTAEKLQEEMPDINCVYIDIADSKFEIPSDVEFEDLTETMEQLMNLAKDFEQNQVTE
jgi:hypothetical protein